MFAKAIESSATAQHHAASVQELPYAILLNAINGDFGIDNDG